jgi:type II secretory pathway pseudopilin PulG
MNGEDHDQGESLKGETLLELVISIAILGLAIVAIASGITVSTMLSGLHRKQATAGTYVRAYAEAIQNTVAGPLGYVKCATTSTYNAPVGFTLPLNSGYSASVTDIQYGTTSGDWISTCTASLDSGTQRLSLQIANTDVRANWALIIVVRNCVASCS